MVLVSKSASYVNEQWLIHLGLHSDSHDEVVLNVLQSGLVRTLNILDADSTQLADPKFFGGVQDRELERFGLYNDLEDNTVSDAVIEFADSLDLDTVTLGEMSEEQKNMLIAAPAVPEPDLGPKCCWWWAHLSDDPWNFFLGHRQPPLRERGHVMWDMARLEEWGLLKTPWYWPEQEMRAYYKEQERLRDEESIEIGSRATIH